MSLTPPGPPRPDRTDGERRTRMAPPLPEPVSEAPPPETSLEVTPPMTAPPPFEPTPPLLSRAPVYAPPLMERPAQPWVPTERDVKAARLAPAATAAEQWDNRKRMLGMLRSLRAEAQNLQRSLLEVKQKSELTDADTRSKELRTALEANEPIFKYNRTRIKALLSSLEKLCAQDSSLYDWAGDELTNISNYWERASLFWPDVTTPEAQVPSRLASVSGQLDDLVYHCALLTVPSRLNQHLAQLAVGQTSDFNDTFSDELPRAEDRQKLLYYMFAHPTSVDGAVDVERGLIYKASPRMERRVASALMIAVVAVLGGVIAYFLPDLAAWLQAPVLELPESIGNRELLAAYLVVLLGGFVHIGIDAVKQVRQAQQKKGPTFLAISNWLMWVHVQEIYIIVGIVWLFIGFLGSVFILKRVEFLTAFLVGYSVDSFADLFLQRFTKFTSSGAEALLK